MRYLCNSSVKKITPFCSSSLQLLMMKNTHFGLRVLSLFILIFQFLYVDSQSNPSGDVSVMLDLKKSLVLPKDLGWTDPNPCNWKNVGCSNDNRITRIQLRDLGITGTLPPNLRDLTALQTLELPGNQITGPLPSLSGLGSLSTLILSGNNFSSIPADFFSGLSMVTSIDLDKIPFAPWNLPDSLKDATALQNFSANSANINGTIPDFLGNAFTSIMNVHLAFNLLEGGIPATFVGSPVQSLWLNGQKSSSRLTEDIRVLPNMTSLVEVSLHSNSFSGPLPDFSGMDSLKSLSLRDNQFTGPFPQSLIDLKNLKILNLTNNLLQGPTPKFDSSVAVDMAPDTNRFCLPSPGDCDPRVKTLLLIASSYGYPTKFAQDWTGDDPCASWRGITCSGVNITGLNFQKLGLTGTIPPAFSSFKSLQRLVLASNNITGTIPKELTTLPDLKLLDLSNNNLYGKVPTFSSNVLVNTSGNLNIGKDFIPPSPGNSSGGSPGSSTGDSGSLESGSKKSSISVGVIVGSVIGGVLVIGLIGLICFCLYKRKQKQFGRVQSPNAMVIHPRHSGSDAEMVKITIAGSTVNVSGTNETYSHGSSGPSDNQVVEAGNMVISIQVLRNVTNNFSPDKILGRGGFGTVYKGELDDGTRIAVKRMEAGVMSGKGLSEFMSEIAVLTKVRHRHLVALLGYCLDGNERLLVYEYMPQGTLSQHLFNLQEGEFKPLDWTRRLTIALDVARGVEYLHGLAQQSFIHRDLKPSNILLGDDMRAKVADFGLVRNAPDGKISVETKLAGTFGYLAPEYAATGRVTTKVDVYSFGVILMELTTGRKALDETQPEESMHLVSWFRRMHLNKENFPKAIDLTLDLTEETIAAIRTVAELAGHCCAREPHQRPDMGHIVNVLSSLVELWKPAEPDYEDMYGIIDLDLTLPQALKKWQAVDGSSNSESTSSSILASVDNTQTSIPTRPSVFADAFTSADGR